ncbi:MFS transporter [Variovorax guangxiensis]|uniref:Putative MFS family arabinose efflux permease n=1 Tax=Variovorax guangxiensis TaxID=1775474 RepID=A0A840FYP2_9BURK|nr:MFS transporter [Variovorax guangxiensis]MBB4225882.1 putative MFS family arabinose efflux permease [Variovorax guangxiensis]
MSKVMLASASTPGDVRSRQIVAIVCCLVAEFFLAADWYAFAAVMSFVSADLALTPGQAGLAQGVFGLSYCMGMLVWSPLVRRIDGRAAFSIGLLGTGIFMGAQALSTSFSELLVYRSVVGFFDAAVWIGAMRLIIGWFPEKRHGSAIGALLASYSLAITLDFAVGVPLAQAQGWRVFFYGLALGTVIVAIAGWLMLRDAPLGSNSISSEGARVSAQDVSSRSVFASKWLYVGAAAIFGATFALSATATWVVPAFVAVRQMPLERAAVIGSAMGLSQIVILLIGGLLADRIDRLVMLKVGAALAAASALVFMVVLTQAVPWGALIAVAIFSGVAVLSGGAIFSALSERFGKELAASAIGYAQIGGVLSSFVAPAAMGWIIERSGGSFLAAFGLFAGVELAVLAILLTLARDPAQLASKRLKSSF